MSTDGPRVELSDTAPVTDVIDIGDAPNPHRRRRLVALAVVLVVLVAGLATWQLWPRPVAPLSAAEMQGVYAGMVRSDGTNDAQQIPGNRRITTPIVDPTTCTALLEPTEAGLVPNAVDGMATYWIEGGGTAMTTQRFADRAAAATAWKRYETALPSCDGREVKVGDTHSVGTITHTPTGPALTGADQLGYRFVIGNLGTPDSQYVFRLVLFNNTVTAVFRLISGSATYSELTDDRVAQSLTEQMKAVQDLRES